MLGKRQGRLPIFQLHCFFYALCFGFPGFFPDASTLSRFVEDAFIIKAQWAALLGVASLVAGFLIGRQIFAHLRAQPSPILIPNSQLSWVGTTVAPGLFIVKLIVAMVGIGFLDQVLEACWQFVFLLLSAAWLRGCLGGTGRLVYLFFLLPLNLFTGLASGHIAAFVMTATTLGILVLAIKKRISWWAVGITASVFILLQPVKAKYRMVAWDESVEIGMIEGLRLFMQIGWESQTDGSSSVNKSLETTVERLNHLHVSGAVVRDTPKEQPFRHGRTYLPLATKWIPRVIWKGKPEERLGNNWAREYGYLGRNDFRTSFNLPWLPEMFINFGWLGVTGVNLLLGLFFAALHRTFLDRPDGLCGLAFGLAISSSLMFVESNLSLMMGAWLIGCFTLFLAGWGLRQSGVVPLKR